LHRVQALQVGQVDVNELGTATVAVYQIRDCLSRGQDIKDDHMRAQMSQGQGNLLADAARGAGYDGNTPLKRSMLQAEFSE
jgi:hypothetical protein